jgi:hypothetical protein
LESNNSISTLIHNAFLLGWSIMELKSRVQITASNMLIDSIFSNQQSSALVAKVTLPSDDSTGNQPHASTPGGNQQTIQTISPVQQQPQSAINTVEAQPDVIDALLEHVILNDIKPLLTQCTASGSKAISTQAQSIATELRDNAWLTSVMREIFRRIVMLHFQRFPNSDTTDTMYDIHPPTQSAQPIQPDQAASDFPYLYLYPGKLDYANVGISPMKLDVAGNGIATTFVQNFRLYDVTRRALNCLTLLWTDPKEALDPATIECFQKMLVPGVLSVLPTTTATDGATTVNDQPTLDEKRCDDLPVPEAAEVKDAIKTLSSLVIRLLEAWDSFLREGFYVDSNSPSNEIELIAYQAGRSLASLTWGISVALAPLESSVHITSEQLDSEIGKALTKKVRDTWVNVFNERDINTLQLQITALSKALDTMPDDANKGATQSGTIGIPASPANRAPGQTIQAVNWSLEYWQRAVTQMCISVPDPPSGAVKPLLTPMPAKVKPLLTSTPTTSTPPIGNTGPQPEASTPQTGNDHPLIPLYWGDSAQALRLALIKQADVWRALLLGERDLQAFNTIKVTQNILNDFMHELEVATNNEFQRVRQRGLSSFRTILFISLCVLVLILAGAIVAAFVPQVRELMTAQIANPLTLIVLLWGGVAAFVSSIMGKLADALTRFGPAGTAAVESFEHGYERVLLEFESLNHNVAITYPLIEFFVLGHVKMSADDPQGEKEKKVEIAIKDGYDFLTKVFWTNKDRQDEIQQVVRAAFGPIGAFVGTELLQRDSSLQAGKIPGTFLNYFKGKG